MKNKIYSIFYLIVIFFYLLRPVIPYINYTINRDYISKNFCIKKDIPGNCCQGKCYLKKQLEKNSIPDDTDKDNNRKNFQDKRLEDHFKENGPITTQSVTDIRLIVFYQASASDSFLLPAFVPPKG